MNERTAARLKLVTAAHNFLAVQGPFPSSYDLQTFLSTASAIRNVSVFDVESILLRVLAVLDRRLPCSIPTLTQRFLQARQSQGSAIDDFRACFESLLRHRGTGHPVVARAIAIIEDSYADPRFTPRQLAERLSIRSDTLAGLFAKVVEVSPTDYLRDVRLNEAARILATTTATAKETWVAVGYNHASNFCHDFKKRFGMSPLQFRERQAFAPTGGAAAPRGASRNVDLAGSALAPHSHGTSSGAGIASILVIDGDTGTRTNIAEYFRKDRHVSITTAETAAEGIRLAIRRPPTVILLDYHLPDANGLECLESIRRQGIGAPVIVFSADWDVEDFSAEFCARRAFYFSKLCDLQALEGQVKSVIAGHTFQPAGLAAPSVQRGA